MVAATNRNLENEVKNGNFREDLYYRLNVFPITVPPLRERGDDVIKLATSFLNKFANNIGLKLEDLSPEEIHSLKSYDWPGNIRELQNVIERAVITSHGGNLNLLNTIPTTSNSTISDQNDLVMDDIKIYTSNELKKLEKENIIRALEKANWKVSGEDGAAIILGIPPTTLSSQIKALKIKKGS